MPSPRRLLLATLLVAGLVAPAAHADVAQPTISAAISGTAGANGWYRSAVTVVFTVSGASSITPGTCGASTQSAETSSATFSCEASATDGMSTATAKRSVSVKVDLTAPSVSGASFARAPDGGGWYNHPVAIAFTGSDNLSGVASCTGATYGGPDSGGVSVSGTCTDVAGNVSGTGTATLKYDATPPQLSGGAADRPPDGGGWYDHPVTVKFS